MAKKNIMLVFLSDAKFHGNWQPRLANYTGGITETKTTSESAIRYILNSGIKLDYLFAFETAMIKENIYREEKKEKIYYHDQFGNCMTHVEYFRQTMKEYLPEIMDDAFYQSSDFNVGLDDNDGSDTMQAVVNMAEKIQSCVDLEQDDVTLHVDCTGGFRSANIAILAVVRLLEYAGVNIGKVVYSNYVKDDVGTVTELKELYNLFNLIAGAEEFTNFGSVKALDKYFENIQDTYKLNSAIENLRQDMRNFSRSMRLCMPNLVEENAVKLMKAIAQFKKCASHGRYEKVFSQLINHIEHEYREFSDGNSSEVALNIIKWCMRKELWQQAITFSYERLPLYICNKKIIEPANPKVKNLKSKIHNTWEHCMLIDGQIGKTKDETLTLQYYVNKYVGYKDDYIDTWKEFLNSKENYINAYLSERDIKRILFDELVNDIDCADNIIEEIKLNKCEAENILLNHSRFAKVLRYMFYIENDISTNFISYICKINKRKIIKALIDADAEHCVFKDDIWNMINILQTCNITKKDRKLLKKYNKNDIWIAAENFWRCCIEQKRIKSIESNPDKIIAVIKAYFDLRVLRNDLNHANANEGDSKIREDEAAKVLNACINSISYIVGK